jgi:hypothetical protein
MFVTDDKKKKKNDSVEPIVKFATKKKLRKKFEKFFSSEQKNFNQEGFKFRQLLMLNPEKIYIVEDFQTKKVLNRALRLLSLKRRSLHRRSSPSSKSPPQTSCFITTVSLTYVVSIDQHSIITPKKVRHMKRKASNSSKGATTRRSPDD